VIEASPQNAFPAVLNKPHGASIPRSTISSPSALNQEKNRLQSASPPVLAVPAFREAKAAEVSCVFRPVAQEHLAFGAETVKIQRQRQRLGLTLALAAFRTPAPAKNTPPVRWPIESYAQAAVLIRGRIDFQIPDRASGFDSVAGAQQGIRLTGGRVTPARLCANKAICRDVGRMLRRCFLAAAFSFPFLPRAEAGQGITPPGDV